MKPRISVISFMLLLLLLPTVGYSQSAPSTYIGGLFHRYTESYLLTGITFVTPIREQMELDLGVDFGILTFEGQSGETTPHFFIPIDVGLNFTFPGKLLTFFVGLGLSPAFLIRPEQDQSVSFLIGPFAKAGMRISVHAVMSVIVEVQQDLLFGGPEWINTNTRIFSGISFSL